VRPLVELINVCKGFGVGPRRTDVLRNVNLAVDEGEFVAVVGWSGAGKTTLVSLIAGLLSPDSGRVLFAGRAVAGPGPERAVVFQNYSLLPWLTVYGNIALAVDRVFADRPAAERRKRVEDHIALVNLTSARDKYPRELSGGMRQRVAVARALAMDPQMLLMDEPLGALDALTRAVLQDEIVRIWEKHRKTVVLITNDVDEGILMADRIIPLSAGPGAALGESVAVDLPRPRNRKRLNRDPAFRSIRNRVVEYLLGPGRRAGAIPATSAENPARRAATLGGKLEKAAIAL
jgi:nitrate/nitrite transport system ATP-binding protein